MRGNILGNNSGLDPLGGQVGDGSPAHTSANNRLAIGQSTDKTVMTVMSIRMVMIVTMFMMSMLMMAKAVDSIVDLLHILFFNFEYKKTGASPKMPGD